MSKVASMQVHPIECTIALVLNCVLIVSCGCYLLVFQLKYIIFIYFFVSFIITSKIPCSQVPTTCPFYGCCYY